MSMSEMSSQEKYLFVTPGVRFNRTSCKQNPAYLPEEDEGALGSLDELLDRAQLSFVLRVEVLRRVDDEEQRGVEDVDRPAVKVPCLHHQLLARCQEKTLPLGLVV